MRIVETAAFGHVILGASVADVVGPPTHAKDAVVAGAARAAIFEGREAIRDLAPLLDGATDGDAPSLTHTAAGVALLLPETRMRIPQKTLLAWVEGGGPLAPLAALSLPSRDDDALHPRIKELLMEGTDPVVRAHVALGLADDPEPSSVSLLVASYANDSSKDVRRAVVRALSRRNEPQRLATLVLARDLDPDEGVRALAEQALRGPIAEDLPTASLTVSFTTVERTVGPSVPLAGRFVRSDGFALPIVSSSDGAVLVAAPPGLASLRMDDASP